MGSGFLALLIFIACLVTVVGLTCACAEFFAQYLPLSYRTLVLLLGGFSMLVSNLGLSHLIQLSVPVLTAIYPLHRAGGAELHPALVGQRHPGGGACHADQPAVRSDRRAQGLGLAGLLPAWSLALPLNEQGLAWLPPSLCALLLAALWDRLQGRPQVASVSKSAA